MRSRCGLPKHGIIQIFIKVFYQNFLCFLLFCESNPFATFVLLAFCLFVTIGRERKSTSFALSTFNRRIFISARYNSQRSTSYYRRLKCYYRRLMLLPAVYGNFFCGGAIYPLWEIRFIHVKIQLIFDVRFQECLSRKICNGTFS